MNLTTPKSNDTVNQKKEKSDMKRPVEALLLSLAAGVIVFASSHASMGQVRAPASASLDIQIPVAPTPVRTNGRMILAYELHITNFRAIDLALTRIEVFSGKQNPAPLASYQDAELSNSLGRPGVRPDLPDKRMIGGGMRAVFFVWLALDATSPVPAQLRHKVSFNLMQPSGNENAVVEGGQIKVRQEAPIVLTAPLRGGRWVALYYPFLTGGHRRAFYAIDGRARIPARFAIDWVRFGEDGRLARGDASRISNWYGYGAEVLAVADSVVVSVKNDFPESASLTEAPKTPLTFENAGGNYLTLDLGNGRFAFYEHLQPGSIRVRIGDRVRSGQVLGLLGNSGSSSLGPHLHFHISDINSPLGAEGLPYVFRSFDVLGAVETIERDTKWVPQPNAEVSRRRMEMPLAHTVLRFP
jgi:murein DD-endopeptidase